jgi:hypothetical protein
MKKKVPAASALGKRADENGPKFSRSARLSSIGEKNATLVQTMKNSTKLRPEIHNQTTFFFLSGILYHNAISNFQTDFTNHDE